jgi:hypothetical protein
MNGLLGYQVGVLTILGLVFAGLSAACIVWVFGQPNKRRVLLGGAGALLGLAGCATFYGWAAFGSPASFLHGGI